MKIINMLYEEHHMKETFKNLGIEDTLIKRYLEKIYSLYHTQWLKTESFTSDIRAPQGC